jgi:hypothetical protein
VRLDYFFEHANILDQASERGSQAATPGIARE